MQRFLVLHDAGDLLLGAPYSRKIRFRGGVPATAVCPCISKGLLLPAAIDVFLQRGRNWHGLCFDTLQIDFVFFAENQSLSYLSRLV